MSGEAKIVSFPDEDRARRTVRWLRRAGLRARREQVGSEFEVLVPSGAEEEARRVLKALESTHTQMQRTKPTGWDWVRSRVLNIETIGMSATIVIVAALLLAVAIWIWALAGMIGWLALILVLVAALVFFHFSGMPHSAVKDPRRFSHKHDVTMEMEQQVQYRLAWARDEWRKSRRWASRWRRSKK